MVVGEDGGYSSCRYFENDEDDDVSDCVDTMRHMTDGDIRLSFVTAHVPLPEPPVVVEGTVEAGVEVREPKA